MAVVGGGIMGRGIAHVLAVRGVGVTVVEPDGAAIDRARGALHTELDTLLRRSRLTDSEATEITSRIEWTSSLEAAADGKAVLIEAAPEVLELKCDIVSRASKLLSSDGFVATNTSALSITRIAAAAIHPDRVIGMHFFNPVPRMALVEVVRATQTSSATVKKSEILGQLMGKTVVHVKDSAGFVTSRVNALIGNEAFRMLSEGVASAADIDEALRLGLNHPMGPFELVDLVGLDTRLSVLNRLRDSLGDRFLPSPLLVNLVEAGRLGRKVGHGVFDYDFDGKRITDEAGEIR
ncbi:3-hydroxyacyl-CoA dehydrogenase family protein [Pseudonocardia oroxyli]|uniref:3-hydroxyacyl-CoA dehydrogenase family protein n=1 Tax=Pseudonocardia oroxyli TaxID=366584 RepID=UPI00115FDC74|nr:3-hydroxyacyl-CoA dehydrogenase NAD-binding domain-containing protein [Pseudonocardia oroxyli]